MTNNTTTRFTTTLGELLDAVNIVTFDGEIWFAVGDCGEDGRVSGWLRLSFGNPDHLEVEYELVADPKQVVEVVEGCLTIQAIDDTCVVDLQESELLDIDLIVGMVRPPTMADIDAARS